uniref:Pre-mRNA-splicing factor PRP11 n=1 Tax=Lygus hesperus TaxID=30085 RepID=A0A146L280_LYGHE
MYEPEEAARRNPYFKRNHVGKVMCTLCNIYCNDEANFMRHLSGKVHATQVERLEMKEIRNKRLEEEESANIEAMERLEMKEIRNKRLEEEESANIEAMERATREKAAR